MSSGNIVMSGDIISKCRSRLKPGVYLIIPHDSKVGSVFPNMEKATSCVLTTSSLGANFNQYEFYFEPGGTFNNRNDENFEHFIFILKGKITVELDNAKKKRELAEGDYAYFPPQMFFSLLNNNNEISRVILIKKKYKPFNSLYPKEVFNNEKNIVGDYRDTHIEQHLLPHEKDMSHDMAINILSFDPGVCFGFVETHIMEHGIYMLNGCGIYWLNGDFYEVKPDDYIYMAPYCPQYFCCTGNEKVRYLLYKETNRDYNEGLK